MNLMPDQQDNALSNKQTPSNQLNIVQMICQTFKKFNESKAPG